MVDGDSDRLVPMSELQAGVPQEVNRWPVIVGVLGLIYGILGCCAHTIAIGGVALSGFWMGLAGIKDPPPMPNAALTVASSAITLVSGILLIVGSVLLLQRRSKCVSFLMTWVVLRLVLVVVGLVAGIALMQSQVEYGEKMDAMVREIIEAKSPGGTKNMPPFDRERQEQISRISLFGISVVMVAFPLFMGVLLTNRKKREEIESWSTRIR
jgi:hypothetical protein